jgi:pimeloyl-ACP methyl ester carboxylesterase
MILKLGPKERQFLGMLSIPSSPVVQRAWLLLSPFGQEAIRTAPLYRVLSERLVRAGQAVLRFDYHGCGDSPGEFGDRGFEHLVDDAIEAFDTLRLHVQAASYACFGVSIGATVAAMAAVEAPTAPDRLLLWEPVVDGAAYCRRLLDTHRRELADELEYGWGELVARHGLAEPAVPGSVLGTDIGPRFAAQLAMLKSLPMAALLKRDMQVDVAADAGTLERFPSGDARLRVQEARFDVNWMTGAAESVAVAPQPIVNFVTSAR